MIQRQLKLRLTPLQEALLKDWLWSLTGVWNWAIRKIERDASDGLYYTPKDFQNLLAHQGQKIGIPSHTLQGLLATAHTAWDRCFKKVAKRPRLKGNRNKLNSIPFPAPIRRPIGKYLRLPGIRTVRFPKQDLPAGKIKGGRLVKRASGWYLCLFSDAQPNRIPARSDNAVGIDPGFKQLLILSSGEHIDHPRELEKSIIRLGQAQRGSNKRLTARRQERIRNQRKDRHHKLSRRLVAENAVIVFSKDHLKGISKRFGKSVASSGHAQLRSMLAYKCTASGRRYSEVASRDSTKTCSACGEKSGPTGLAGLSVRQWVCTSCGTIHDRDINAAVNTLIAGLGASHEEAA